MATYSFLDVTAAISGVGGSINLGAGAAVSEEGITFEPAEDKNIMTIGADGNGMHALVASTAGTCTVRLLQTSPTNALLQQMYNAQTRSSATHGRNTITIRNPATGDAVQLTQAAFAKQPSLTWSKDGQLREWTWHCIKSNVVLGTGTPEA